MLEKDSIDSLFADAELLIVASQIGSTLLLQRRMKLQYNRTAWLMDQLEDAGIVGPSQGSRVRDVMIRTQPGLEKLLRQMGIYEGSSIDFTRNDTIREMSGGVTDSQSRHLRQVPKQYNKP